MQSGAEAVPASELRAKYLALLEQQDREFGYIVRSIAAPGVPGGGGGGPIVLNAVRITPDAEAAGCRLSARLVGRRSTSTRAAVPQLLMPTAA